MGFPAPLIPLLERKRLHVYATLTAARIINRLLSTHIHVSCCNCALVVLIMGKRSDKLYVRASEHASSRYDAVTQTSY